VVNTWKNNTQGLASSTTHQHAWKRVGKFDLPETVTIFTAKEGFPASGNLSSNPFDPDRVLGDFTQHTWTLTFANHKLMPSKE
jgi:hypothetical protein